MNEIALIYMLLNKIGSI